MPQIEQTFTEREFYRVIGENIRNLRLKHQMNQEKFAEFIGKTRATVSLIESGESRISIFALVNVCNSLDIELSDIIPNKITTVVEFGGIGSIRKPSDKQIFKRLVGDGDIISLYKLKQHIANGEVFIIKNEFDIGGTHIVIGILIKKGFIESGIHCTINIENNPEHYELVKNIKNHKFDGDVYFVRIAYVTKQRMIIKSLSTMGNYSNNIKNLTHHEYYELKNK